MPRKSNQYVPFSHNDNAILKKRSTVNSDQKFYHDRKASEPLSTITDGLKIWALVNDRWKLSRVTRKLFEPRSEND